MSESQLVHEERTERPSGCFACGPDHPNGLRIRFEEVPGHGVVARWTPAVTWEGHPGVIHGGIVSTVLDEAMYKAVACAHSRAFTAEMRVRLKEHVETGRELVIRGWVTEQKRRLIKAEASVTDLAGTERAHAWGSFLEPAAAQSARQDRPAESTADEPV